ncbi:MAG: class I SAM-dependent methyltransferase [Clostridia bacterium]|nr:class I SAM-dependent methyltransferase [Clostridia bacterium]
MNNVNKTLYIPLYGKAYVSQKGILLSDKKAEEIWAAEGFKLGGKSKSKWLAYYMGIRSAVFDEWLSQKMDELENAVVLHIGCGMDSRVLRVGTKGHKWYDVDFSDVITERGRYYTETEDYKMLAGDAKERDWLSQIPPKGHAVIVLEGVSMYLSYEEMQNLINNLCAHFGEVSLLVDCYTTLAAKMSKYKNPINEVGVTQVYGIDEPTAWQTDDFLFACEREMTPQKYIDELKGMEKKIFQRLYAGGFSKKLYRLFEYQKKSCKP